MFFFQERKGRKEGEFDSVGFCGNLIWICANCRHVIQAKYCHLAQV